MTNFTSHQLRKAGFIHHTAKDFSDDGTRFQIWEMDDVFVSYAKVDGQVYLAVRPDYAGFGYKEYSMWPSYGGHDEFNGVNQDRVDVAKLVATVKMLAAEQNKARDGEKVIETDVNKMSYDELKEYLRKKHLNAYASALKADKVFNLAWEYGHSSGHSEVENYYIDLADIAN